MSKQEIEPRPVITDEMNMFVPSEREDEIVKNIISKFRNSRDERNRVFKLFNNRTLIEFINDSVWNYIANTDERGGIEDWQARVHDGFTNNKVTAILGKALESLPLPRVVARGDEDIRRSAIINDLYHYSEEVDGFKENMKYVLEEALVKGTAVVYEGVRVEDRDRRWVKGVRDDVTIKSESVTETKLYSELVPLEDFYPGSISLRELQENPFCFWRTEMPYTRFMAQWASSFDKASKVQPFAPVFGDEDKPFYTYHITEETREGNVEVVRFYDQFKDQYVIIANGIWLNPIDTKDAKEDIAPLPFNHKRLPFWTMKFAINGDWFYGRSLCDKLMSMQAILNVLTNMLLDQSFLTIFPPMLSSGFDSIEDDYLRPGRRTPIDTQGLPINQAFMKLDLGTPGGWHQFILEYTRSIMEESSLDKVSQGIAGQGDRTTAAEIRTAAAGVASVLGLFGSFRDEGLKKKATLRTANVLQFWTDPNSPYLTGILSETGQENMSKAFNTFEIDSTTLTGGKRGTRIIEMFKEDKDLPNTDELKARSAIAEADTGKAIEFISITPSYIRNFRYDVKLELNPDNESTKEIKQALQLEKVRVYLSFFPEMVNKEELLAETAVIMGDDPTKIISQKILEPVEDQDNNELDKGLSTSPEQNVANNTIRGELGLGSGETQLGQL